MPNNAAVRQLALANIQTWAEYVSLVFNHAEDKSGIIYLEMDLARKVALCKDLVVILGSQGDKTSADFIRQYYEFRGAGEIGLGQSVLLHQEVSTTITKIADDLSIIDIQQAILSGLKTHGLVPELIHSFAAL